MPTPGEEAYNIAASISETKLKNDMPGILALIHKEAKSWGLPPEKFGARVAGFLITDFRDKAKAAELRAALGIE